MELAGLTPSAKCPPPRSGCGCPHPSRPGWGARPMPEQRPRPSRCCPRAPAYQSTPWPTPGSRTAGPCPESRGPRRCSASQIATPCPHPQPALGRTRARRTQKQGSLRISLTSGRTPPTKPRDWGGGSSCRPVGPGLPGTLPPPGTLRRAGRKPGVRRGEGPSLRATAH